MQRPFPHWNWSEAQGVAAGGPPEGEREGGGDTAMVTEDAKFIFCFLRTKKGQEEAEGKKKNVRK